MFGTLVMAEPPESRASVSSPVSEDASVSSSAISEDGSKSSSSGQESSEDESMRFILKCMRKCSCT